MRRLIVLAILFVSVVTVNAQSVDNFYVGPYEVDYKGEGDFKFRLRKGIDLYEYYGLKKDTIILNTVNEPHPVKHGVQINAFMSLPRFAIKGNSNSFGISGSWKQQIGKVVYFNAGLSLAYSYGSYNYDENWEPYYRIENMIEVGVPVSFEFTKLDHKKASVYAGIGVVPSFYNTIKVDETTIENVEQEGAEYLGFLLSPRVDFGGNIPLNNKIFRIGVFGEYKINCYGDINIYEERVGRAFVGANVGFIF